MSQVELTGAPLTIDAALVAFLAFEEDLAGGPSGVVAEVDRALGGHLASAARDERFEGKVGQALVVSTLGRLRAARVQVLGLGKRATADLARSGFEAVRMAAGKAARAALAAGAGRMGVVVPDGLDPAPAVQAIVEGALLGAYRFDRYKREEGEPKSLRTLVVALPEEAARAREVREAVSLARNVADAVAFARDLVNEPPAECTPARLARAAQVLARRAGLGCKVRGRKEIEALGMGLFLGVARGSAEEPRLVTLSWSPPRARARARPLVLVGKAITFDSGGLSLKPTDSMVTMKGDMAGSAAVLGALRVIAELEPPFPVHAVLGACENMPGGRAYKPGDVLRAYDGTTVEVTNTDAEGRLVLGDVLAWAVETLRPAAVVDVATLTGACVVGLGKFTTGVFGPDGPAVEAVLSAAAASGEDAWRLPMPEAVKENLESDVADLKNSGERWGGAIAAAHFLHRFTHDVPWAHLDIAGPAHSAKERGYVPKGATGVGVRTLVELARRWEAP